MDDNRSYFMRRAAEERSAANRATDQAARGAHLELARRYGELAAPAQQAETSGPIA
jgi:hypothetical protein